MSLKNQSDIKRYFLRNSEAKNQQLKDKEMNKSKPTKPGENSSPQCSDTIRTTAGNDGGPVVDNTASATASNADVTVSNAELKSIILRLEKSMSGILDKLEDDIESVKIKQTENEDKLQGVKYDVDKAVADITLLHQDMHQRHLPDLHNKWQYLSNKLLLMEIHERKLNLIFYGVEQTADEDVISALHNCWQSDFGLSQRMLRIWL
jgi:hypothetical protein